LVRLAERISGEQLDELFNAWLFTSEKPELAIAAMRDLSRSSGPTAAARHLVARLKMEGEAPAALR
jgi:hypothetical protein